MSLFDKLRFKNKGFDESEKKQKDDFLSWVNLLNISNIN